MINRNRSARNAYIEKKSWKAGNGHKGYWKRFVGKLARLGAKEEIRRVGTYETTAGVFTADAKSDALRQHLEQVQPFSLNDIVTTIAGVARITYIRRQGGELLYETTAGVFTADEIEAT